MPKRERRIYVCQTCGAIFSKWHGRCSTCNEWNTLVETIEHRETGDKNSLGFAAVEPTPITQVIMSDYARLKSGIVEFDRVLGGGVVVGSVVLLGGDPGIGKSTLLLQIIHAFCRNLNKCIYFSAEESPSQLKIRAERLGTLSENLFISSESNIDKIVEYIKKILPKVVIIDSIQMMYKEEIPSPPGTITQLRESTMRLITIAKKLDVTIFIIGHITKEGIIAGPKTLEHLVDTVLYLEGDRYQTFRILRSVKNRFGPTNEIGTFNMDSRGLIEVSNPSELFLSTFCGGQPGSTVAPALVGSRILLVEIQALTPKTYFGIPTRKATGPDLNRMNMLIAVLEKRAGIRLGSCDVFVNIVGGINIDEPAIDFAQAIAIASSVFDKTPPSKSVFIGEMDLAGSIRPVPNMDLRIVESTRLGFQNIFISENILFKTDNLPVKPIFVANIIDAVQRIFK